jgi:hypothetical protein
VALEDILGWMILSGEGIVEIRCFLVGLVTGDNWQYDHGDGSHKRMKGDNWQNNHGDKYAGRQDHAVTDVVEYWDQRQSCLCMK